MSKPVPWVKFDIISDNCGQFVVAPLERGLGTTIGNSMRRVLLSALPGYAITSIKIDGVQHEFSSVPHVYEDVLDIIGNLKIVVFKGVAENQVVLKIDVKGPGDVLAKDIKSDSDFTVVNPDLKLATITEKGSFSAELTVERGIGYQSVEQRTDLSDEIDVIHLDASFSPIVRVNHQVESIRVGKELNFDQLILEVETNGSISPEDAVRYASDVLVNKFNLFNNLNAEPVVERESRPEPVESSANKDALSMSVDDLELSARSSNCLKRAGISLVSDLVEKDLSELIKIKNFGKKSADEINEKLSQFNLQLKSK